MIKSLLRRSSGRRNCPEFGYLCETRKRPYHRKFCRLRATQNVLPWLQNDGGVILSNKSRKLPQADLFGQALRRSFWWGFPVASPHFPPTLALFGSDFTMPFWKPHSMARVRLQAMLDRGISYFSVGFPEMIVRMLL